MAVAINLSDPGAVPGASTGAALLARFPAAAGSVYSKERTGEPHRWGRNRIDEGVKGALLLGMVPPLSGQTHSCQRQLCSGCPGCVTQFGIPIESPDAVSSGRRGSEAPGNRSLHFPFPPLVPIARSTTGGLGEQTS